MGSAESQHIRTATPTIDSDDLTKKLFENNEKIREEKRKRLKDVLSSLTKKKRLIQENSLKIAMDTRAINSKKL